MHHYTVQRIALAFLHVAKQMGGAYMNNIIVFQRNKEEEGKKEGKHYVKIYPVYEKCGKVVRITVQSCYFQNVGRCCQKHCNTYCAK